MRKRRRMRRRMKVSSPQKEHAEAAVIRLVCREILISMEAGGAGRTNRGRVCIHTQPFVWAHFCFSGFFFIFFVCSW